MLLIYRSVLEERQISHSNVLPIVFSRNICFLLTHLFNVWKFFFLERKFFAVWFSWITKISSLVLNYWFSHWLCLSIWPPNAYSQHRLIWTEIVRNFYFNYTIIRIFKWSNLVELTFSLNFLSRKVFGCSPYPCLHYAVLTAKHNSCNGTKGPSIYINL